MVTESRFLSFHKLQLRAPQAVTLVKLMMACNDLTFTNQALDDWKNETRPERKATQAAGCRYFICAQLSHLYEAIDVIQNIQDDPALFAFVGRCDHRTQEAFRKLQRYVKDGDQHSRFEAVIGRIRNNITFHYPERDKEIAKAIAKRAARSQVSSITRGSTSHLWFFKVADDVIDSIVVRDIWKVPDTTDLRSGADEIAVEVHQIQLLFLDFAGEFIWKYAGTLS